MSNILANSEIELNQIEDLLSKNVPSYRQAYSDRTAWVMSCLSELAYIRFNPLFSNEEQKDYFIKNISKLVDKNKKSSLIKLLDIVGYDHAKEKEKLENELDLLKIDLIKTFDCNGTQAILVSFKSLIVLAFRGTEATSIKDIKSDVKAKITQCETGGMIHSGFKEAFEQVSLEIQNTVNETRFENTPLFITGHSLGGALATVATKKLTHKGGLAACYTFGSPRVGNKYWIENIKTPIYRLVNSADSVTMVPPSAIVISAISWFSGFIPNVGKSVKRWLTSNFGGYLHCGDMRYLTNCPKGQFNKVKLLPHVNIVYRVKGLIIAGLPFKHFLADHSMSNYRKKLMIIAQNRNIKS